MSTTARAKAIGIISGGRVEALEAAGLQVIGHCADCKSWELTATPELVAMGKATGRQHRACVLLSGGGNIAATALDFGCRYWEGRE